MTGSSNYSLQSSADSSCSRRQLRIADSSEDRRAELLISGPLVDLLSEVAEVGQEMPATFPFRTCQMRTANLPVWPHDCTSRPPATFSILGSNPVCRQRAVRSPSQSSRFRSRFSKLTNADNTLLPVSVKGHPLSPSIMNLGSPLAGMSVSIVWVPVQIQLFEVC